MEYFRTAEVTLGIDSVEAGVVFQTGLPSPEACHGRGAVNHYACNEASGFAGTFDTRSIANGPHTLTVVAVPNFGTASRVEVPFIVANP
jgi:hypothetical protein